MRPPSYPNATSRVGFSLIELLAVIAVVAILAVMLFPAVSRMQRNALIAEDVSNLRQIGIGILSYAHDNDMSLPGPLYAQQMVHYRAGNFRGHLSSVLPAYVGAPEPDSHLRELTIMVDPAWRQIRNRPLESSDTCYRMVQLRPRDNAATFMKGRTVFGYAGYTGQDDSQRTPLKLHEIPNTFPLSGIPIITNTNLSENGGRPSHTDRRNVLFVDGRVETFAQGTTEFEQFH